jgi:Tfp pilus assembly protein PilN
MKRSLGVSVRNGTLAFVELGRLLGRVRVLRSGSLPAALPGGATAADPAHDPWSALVKGGRPAAVVLGLPRRAVVMRILELPVSDEKDLAGLVSYELERHLPFPPEEAYYGFRRIGQAGPRSQVLLVAARKAEVDRHIERLERVGLRPTAIGVSSLAAASTLPATAGGVCLVDHEEEEAEVSVLRQGLLRSSRAVPLGEDGLGPLVAEIRRATADLPAPVEIRASAGEAVREALAAALERPVAPWRRGGGAGQASAYGLALQGLRTLPIGVDLLPTERRPPAPEPALRAMVVLVVLVALLGAGLLVGRGYREQQTLNRLRAEAARVRADAGQVDALRGRAADLQGRLKALDAILEERERPLLVLKELATLLPKDVTLTEFSLDGSKLQIRGSTGGSPADLIAAFEKSALFENAAFASPIAAQGKDRQGFQLQAFVRIREGGAR